MVAQVARPRSTVKRRLPGTPLGRLVALVVAAVIVLSILDAESDSYEVPGDFYNLAGAAVSAAVTYAALTRKPAADKRDEGDSGQE